MKPKILHAAFYSMDIGGVQKVILDIAENLPGCHSDVVVFTADEGRFEPAFKKAGGRVFRITEYEGENRLRLFLEIFIKKFRIFRGTYRILRKYGPYDAIHSHNQFRSGFTNAAAFFAGVRIRIAHSHNDRPPGECSFFRKILLDLYRLNLMLFSNVRLACSRKAAAYLFHKEKRAEIIYNGSDTARFDQSAYPYEPDGKARFIHVGRYDVQKNQMFLLDVFSYILKKVPGSSLSLIGFGKDEEKISGRIAEPDLKGSVRMFPPDSDIPSMMAMSEFMIFPSLYEGFPIVHIEAQLMGVRCFVSGSVTRESDIGLTTYIDADKTAEEWAMKITEGIRNHDYSKKPSVPREAREKVDTAAICRRYESIYKGTGRDWKRNRGK